MKWDRRKKDEGEKRGTRRKEILKKKLFLAALRGMWDLNFSTRIEPLSPAPACIRSMES